MKKLILPPIPGHRFRMQDLEYLEQGTLWAIASLIKAKLPVGYSGLVIVEGCEISVAGTTYDVAAGSIFYKASSTPAGAPFSIEEQGELIQVDAHSINSATPPQWELYREEPTTFVEPRLFRDNSQHFINQEWRARLKTGAGVAVYNEVRKLSHIEHNLCHEIGQSITLHKLPDPDFLTDNFDSSGLGKEYTKWEGFALSTGDNGTVDMAGVGSVGYNFKENAVEDVRDTGDYTILGALVGAWKKLINRNNLPAGVMVGGVGGGSSLGGYTIGGAPGSGNFNNARIVTNGAGDGETTVEGGVQMDIRQPVKACLIIEKVADITA